MFWECRHGHRIGSRIYRVGTALLRWPLGYPGLAPFRELMQPASAGGALTARFLGTSSVLFQDAETAILSDGFITRPRLSRVLFWCIAPDRGRVNQVLDQLKVDRIAAVFCGHAHYDHALDAPLVAKLTGADLVGCESIRNVGRGWDLPRARLRVVRDGEILRYGKFRLTFVESTHSPGDRAPGIIDKPLVPPRHVRTWKTGQVWSVVIEHEGRRVLMHGSANVKPGALHDHPVDTVYLGIGMLGRQCDACVKAYWDEVVVATGARRVILVHWDDVFRGLDRQLRPMRYALDPFPENVKRIRRLAKDDVEVLLPVLNRPTDPFAGLPRRV